MNRDIDPNSLPEAQIFDTRSMDELRVDLEPVRLQIAAMNGGMRLAAANKLLDRLREETDELSAYVMLKQAEDVISEAIDLQKDNAINAMDEKTKTIWGAKLETKRSKAFEYVHPRLTEIAEQIKALNAEAKSIKLMLENMKEPMIYESTGEVIEPAKCLKDGLQIAVTLPK